MRLEVLGRGQSVVQRFLFAFVRLTAGDVPGPLAVLSYRSSFFGTAFGAALHEAMRNQSAWTLGEVELFAAWVSHHNECAY